MGASRTAICGRIAGLTQAPLQYAGGVAESCALDIRRRWPDQRLPIAAPVAGYGLAWAGTRRWRGTAGRASATGCGPWLSNFRSLGPASKGQRQPHVQRCRKDGGEYVGTE